MVMEAGLDTGPVLGERRVATAGHNAESLAQVLAAEAAALTTSHLSAALRGELTETPQDNDLAVYAHRIQRHEGQINFLGHAEVWARKRVPLTLDWVFGADSFEPIKRSVSRSGLLNPLRSNIPKFPAPSYDVMPKDSGSPARQVRSTCCAFNSTAKSASPGSRFALGSPSPHKTALKPKNRRYHEDVC